MKTTDLKKGKKCIHQWYYLGIFFDEYVKFVCPNCRKVEVIRI